VVVRAGTAPDGLPIGIQVVAHPWRDDVALAVAQAIEASTGGWKRPAI
jgi:amidase